MTGKPIKILLVEDNPGDARLIQEMVSEVDGDAFDLERVDRLSTGLKHLSVKDVDLVLLDLSLPNSAGLDTFKKVHAHVPEVPIIIFTGLNNAKIAIECVRIGARDYLVKGRVDGDLLPCKLLYAIERKKAREALRESLGKYRSLIDDVLETSDIGVFILDAEFKVLRINRSTEKYFGLRRKDVIGKDKRQLIHKRIKDIFEDPETFKKKVLATYDNNTYIENFECHVLPDEERKEYWLEHWSQPIRSGLYKGGRIEHYSDITRRKSAEQALRRSEKKYRVLFETAKDAIFLSDLTGKFVDVNSAACESLGYNKEELLKLSNRKIDADSRGYEAFQKVRNGLMKEATFEVNQQRKDGTLIPAEISGNVIESDGGKIFLAIARDITDRKQAEKELAKYRDHLEELVKERTRDLEAAQEELIKREKLSVLGQLTATVSHEIRNPLGVIRSSAFYLQRKSVGKDKKTAKHLNRIEEQVALCDTIVGDLLEFTRGRHSEAIHGEINPLLEKVLEEMATPEQVTLVRELSPELPMVLFDRDKMRRVMINLIRNAFQAVTMRREKWDKGESPYQPLVKVTSSAADAGIRIEVEDNGTGMNDETARRAFEPLFTTWARGTGLGLAIVKKIVEEHGGSVSLDSILNHGTKVTVIIPTEIKKG